MVLTTAINGDRAFALPVALRRRPEARLLPPPPARSIQAARNGSPALRLGKTPAVLRLEGRLVPLRLADATVPSLRADPTLKPNGAVAVPINAKARALSRARASARPMCRNCVATVAPSPASLYAVLFRARRTDAAARALARHLEPAPTLPLCPSAAHASRFAPSSRAWSFYF